MKFVLLGSGAVRCDLTHWGPAQVVQVGRENLLFDCGRGATMRLKEAGIPFEAIRRVFFTHHHYDHNCDFAYFFLTGWVLGRNFPLEIYGPRGTEQFCRGLFWVAYEDDINSRRYHPAYTEQGCNYVARDILESSLTLKRADYTLKIVHTLHMPHVLDSLAFRIEAEGKSIVVAGDNMISEPLMALAEGCDLLVHECTFPSERVEDGEWGNFHTAPRALGKWAKERGVKKLLLKHFAVQPGVEIEPMADEVREGFGEEGVVVGRDLLVIDV